MIYQRNYSFHSHIKRNYVLLWNGTTGEVKEIRKVYLNSPYGQFVFSSYKLSVGKFILLLLKLFFFIILLRFNCLLQQKLSRYFRYDKRFK